MISIEQKVLLKGVSIWLKGLGYLNLAVPVCSESPLWMNSAVCVYVSMPVVVELRLRGKTFENSLYQVHLKDENQNTISTYWAVPRQAQFNPGQGIPKCSFWIPSKYSFVLFFSSDGAACVRKLSAIFVWHQDSHSVWWWLFMLRLLCGYCSSNDRIVLEVL